MGYLSPLPIPLFVALGAALFLTPACRRLAFRFGVVDRPGGKKIHGQATPLLGGVAIALALAAGMAASGTADQASLRILVASGFILLLGIWDDLDPHAEALRWWLRLLYEGWLAGIVSALRRLDMAPSDARPSLGAFCALRAWRIVTRDV